MVRPACRAIVLDLFDTLVKWEPERLPLMELRGKTVRTTMPWIFPKLEELFGAAFDRDQFIEIYAAVTDEITAEREREGIEVTCHERFRRALARLQLGRREEIDEPAESLTRVHMAQVRRVTWAPAPRVEAVRRLAPHYRLALLSNFDDSQCGREVLADTGVADLFEAVVISAEVGLRKPDRRIFELVRMRLGLAPDKILVVGDTPRDDVLGASNAGMGTVWISKGQPAPVGMPAPDLVINDLAELPHLLEL